MPRPETGPLNDLDQAKQRLREAAQRVDPTAVIRDHPFASVLLAAQLGYLAGDPKPWTDLLQILADYWLKRGADPTGEPPA